MNLFREKMNQPFGEVVTEKQFNWLQEIVFLSALEEVLQTSLLAHRNPGEGPYPEQFTLFQQIFGMSPKEFDKRLESFKQHNQRKGELNE